MSHDTSTMLRQLLQPLTLIYLWDTTLQGGTYSNSSPTVAKLFYSTLTLSGFPDLLDVFECVCLFCWYVFFNDLSSHLPLDLFLYFFIAVHLRLLLNCNDVELTHSSSKLKRALSSLYKWNISTQNYDETGCNFLWFYSMELVVGFNTFKIVDQLYEQMKITNYFWNRKIKIKQQSFSIIISVKTVNSDFGSIPL